MALVLWKNYPVEKERIGMYLFGRIAQDPDKPECYLSLSAGRRKFGRPQRYYIIGHGLRKTLSVTADSDAEAVVKANAKLQSALDAAGGAE